MSAAEGDPSACLSLSAGDDAEVPRGGGGDSIPSESRLGHDQSHDSVTASVGQFRRPTGSWLPAAPGARGGPPMERRWPAQTVTDHPGGSSSAADPSHRNTRPVTS